MRRPRVLCCFGTRPCAIKMAPVVHALQAADDLDCQVVVTAQHRQMLDQVLEIFRITPDVDLDLMTARQTVQDVTARVLLQMTPVLAELQPDLVLVHGDTTTGMAAALASFYQQIPVGHVEAGLRTPDLMIPFPEEMNRRVIDRLSTLFFAPTPTAQEALAREGITSGVFVTGNTVVDALLYVRDRIDHLPLPPWHEQLGGYRILLVTAHRRESWDEGLANIARALRRLVEEFPDTAVLFPIHKNPVVREQMGPLLEDHPRIALVEPLDYEAFVQAMRWSHLVLTDSGGIQEEAPSLNLPVLVMRDVTERTEGIAAGCVRLVGTQTAGIVGAAREILSDPGIYQHMATAQNPYGDGQAAEKILTAIRQFFGNALA
ncbi:MAG: UDP-N-acetylglucosamine 2-epimerase [bacterium]|nr:UDP-N-acetylglucosamine 2-epimerase [bacterium]